jgi:hypothetical protein
MATNPTGMLCKAIRNGERNKILNLLTKHQGTFSSKDYQKAFQTAAKYNETGPMELLFQLPPSILNGIDFDRILMVAVDYQNESVVRWILDYTSLSLTDQRLNLAFVKAALHDDGTIMRHLKKYKSHIPLETLGLAYCMAATRLNNPTIEYVMRLSRGKMPPIYFHRAIALTPNYVNWYSLIHRILHDAPEHHHPEIFNTGVKVAIRTENGDLIRAIGKLGRDHITNANWKAAMLKATKKSNLYMLGEIQKWAPSKNLFGDPQRYINAAPNSIIRSHVEDYFTSNS